MIGQKVFTTESVPIKCSSHHYGHSSINALTIPYSLLLLILSELTDRNRAYHYYFTTYRGRQLWDILNFSEISLLTNNKSHRLLLTT